MMKRTVLGLAALVTSSLVLALDLAPNAPDVYVVKKGDTLWDIAGHYLKNPWAWPEVWQANPQVDNPHLIYPGDVLTLVYVDGQPRVQRATGEIKMPDGTVKLSPAVRVLSEGQAVPTLPRELIAPFLQDARVVNPEDIDKTAYVVASEGEHVVTGAGDHVYVRGVNSETKNYNFFRTGPAYRDPETEEILGYEALYVGTGFKTRDGDPATFDIRKATSEVRVGDRAMPLDEAVLDPLFLPQPAPANTRARIISVYGGVSQIGQYAVVVLSRGEKDGIRTGHTLTAWTDGAVINDTVGKRRVGEEPGFFERIGNWFSSDSAGEVKLPNEEAGTMMVFRTFDRVSLALVMKATRAMHVGDVATDPVR